MSKDKVVKQVEDSPEKPPQIQVVKVTGAEMDYSSDSGEFFPNITEYVDTLGYQVNSGLLAVNTKEGVTVITPMAQISKIEIFYITKE